MEASLGKMSGEKIASPAVVVVRGHDGSACEKQTCADREVNGSRLGARFSTKRCARTTANNLFPATLRIH